jgi:hypothetical protein
MNDVYILRLDPVHLDKGISEVEAESVTPDDSVIMIIMVSRGDIQLIVDSKPQLVSSILHIPKVLFLAEVKA